MLPLVRDGDPTRTLIDATRPLHERTRVRSRPAGRDRRGLAAIALYGLFLATVGLAMAHDAAAERTVAVLERYEAVIGIEVHCQLRTVSKMFCALLDGLRRRRPRTRTSARSALGCPARCR